MNIRFCNSNIRQYNQEVIITACFYIVGKIVEDQKRIRDILVILSVVTSLYRQANYHRNQKFKEKGLEDIDKDPIKYLSLKKFEQKEFDYFDALVTPLNNEQYIDWKYKILEAEQHLLRIINYDLRNETLENYQVLLNYIQLFNFDQPLRQLIFDIFQDSYFVNFEFTQLECVKGSIYLGIQLHRMYCAEIQKLPKLKQEFCSTQWWEEFMQISYKTLLQFEIEMLEYFKMTSDIQEKVTQDVQVNPSDTVNNDKAVSDIQINPNNNTNNNGDNQQQQEQQ